ncbi:hypothetical protein NUW54_g14684 [Trametes sanguinea]|uniref:Uncharacterized protein n=1 Tax=Trametes sanguinea TaxID=158606 RepID=A0ACC1MAT2_9APHY|nr:hypothetical protein NUW54_g14684 [Trametes sanguinea]
MAPQEMRSEMYCGEIVSSSSEPTGTPMAVRSQRSWRARRRPLLILNEPSMSGSLMRPFQPTVVRGFCAMRACSKLTLGLAQAGRTNPFE